MNNVVGNTLPDEKRFFDTEHLKADIKGHSIRGAAVTVTAQGIKFILLTGSTAVLARLLTPADFGLIAMVEFFTAFIIMFKDLGLSMATIQKKDITHEQITSLFWINVVFSILLMFMTIAISPLVARFYNEPRLTMITIATGCTLIIGGLNPQHMALLNRQMRFVSIAVINIVSLTCGIVAAIIGALLGLSYWSLILMTIVQGLVCVIMVWSISGWRPGRPAVGKGVKSMLTFGGNLTGSSVLGYFIRNADNAIIGYALGSASLGIYTKAYGLLMLPIRQFNSPMQRIMIPTLSRLQDEPKQYRSFYLQALAAIALITMPMVTFLFVSANEIVDILLGSEWTAVAPTFRFLAPAAFLGAINFAPGWLFVSLGRVGTQFRWTILSAPVIIIGFLIGVNWGINGVAASVSITWSVMFVLAVYWATQQSPVKFYDFIQVLSVPVASSLLAAIGSFLAGRIVLQYNSIIRLAVYSIVFVICYFACVIATPKGRRLIKSMINAISKLRKKNSSYNNNQINQV
ncbi:MAG: lipopolysaccharide biosynthesis protein [Sedimentisphaerales bacterium]|nr:lipopolysaccharide biosynthesis protein [Sedimentisphaerales bacterium]